MGITELYVETVYCILRAIHGPGLDGATYEAHGLSPVEPEETPRL